jgi:hypothetical protein
MISLGVYVENKAQTGLFTAAILGLGSLTPIVEMSTLRVMTTMF